MGRYPAEIAEGAQGAKEYWEGETQLGQSFFL
jgi:hypothetical protein